MSNKFMKKTLIKAVDSLTKQNVNSACACVMHQPVVPASVTQKYKHN